MSNLLSEALRLQNTAREILNECERGIVDQEGFEDRTVQWALARQKFAEMDPDDTLDALSQLHSLKQAAVALLPCRESPVSVDGLAAELILGLQSLIAYHERLLGRSREELALFEDYVPPGPIN